MLLPLLFEQTFAPPSQVMLDYVDSRGASRLPPGSYALVTQYPRRVFLPEQAGESLGALGLEGPREVLFLEPHKQ